jgi:hypothetical protein
MSNSRQINFFISNDDLKAIQLYFGEIGMLVVEVNRSGGQFEVQIALKPFQENCQLFLTTEIFLNEIYVNRGSVYPDIEVLRSKVIEFDVGGFSSINKFELIRSRLYFVSKFYDSDLVGKDQEFIEWASNVMKGFKRRFLKKTSISKDFWMSSSVFDWAEKNNASLNIAGDRIVGTDKT